MIGGAIGQILPCRLGENQCGTISINSNLALYGIAGGIGSGECQGIIRDYPDSVVNISKLEQVDFYAWPGIGAFADFKGRAVIGVSVISIKSGVADILSTLSLVPLSDSVLAVTLFPEIASFAILPSSTGLFKLPVHDTKPTVIAV